MQNNPPVVCTERQGPVFIVTINRPEVRNAIDDPLRADLLASMEEIAAADPLQGEAHICRALVLWLRGGYDEALNELSQALNLEPDPHEHWKALCWRALICGWTIRDDEAVIALQHALASGLPLSLAAPLRWLEEGRPEFYAQRLAPLLTAAPAQA